MFFFATKEFFIRRLLNEYFFFITFPRHRLLILFHSVVQLADKVLKSLQPTASASAPVPGTVSPSQFTNADKLTYIAVLLALQPPTQSVNTTNDNNINTTVSTHILHCTSLTVHNALSLLTQYAHNLHGFNPIFGTYNSELKPSKSTANKTGKNGNTSVIRFSGECIVVAMETLQNAILVRLFSFTLIFILIKLFDTLL